MTDSILTANSFLTFLVAALASYRVARMVVAETGPFAIFAKLRWRIDRKQETWIGIGLNCPYCVGLWVSIPFLGLLVYSQNNIVHFLIYVLAVAGIQTIIQSWEPIPTHLPPMDRKYSDSHLSAVQSQPKSQLDENAAQSTNDSLAKTIN